MNIGIDLRPLLSSIRTGVGEYTFELVKALLNIDNKNQYFLFYNSNKENIEYPSNWKNKNVHFVETKYPNKLFNSYLKMLNYPKLDKLAAKRDNRLQTTDYSVLKKKNLNIETKSLDYWFSPNLNFTSLSNKTKHVLTIHDLSYEIYPKFFSQKQRLWHKMVNPKKQCEAANLILTPSENTKRDLVNLYKIKEEKIKVLYPGISTDFVKNSEARERKEKIIKKYNLPENYILFLGTIEPRKNIISLIEAYKMVQKDLNKQYTLVIGGAKGWQDKEVMELINKNKNSVQNLGYISPEDKPVIYQNADLFVYPSFYEGFGFPVLEAFYSGVPVVTSNRSSLPEITNGAAYLINPYNIADLANGLKLILNDDRLKNLFIERGKERVKNFEWKKTGERLLEFLG